MSFSSVTVSLTADDADSSDHDEAVWSPVDAGRWRLAVRRVVSE
jgi:hypothetical protein